jgi:anaerobic ribonucleoside-triphosphate reductase
MEEIKLKDSERSKCEIWTRVMGYHRATTDFNVGKKSEYKERKTFKEGIALKSLAVA